MDVGDWLRTLGLGRYEASFRQHQIDEAILPKLTVEDLKELGVTIVGHRRKLIVAIGGLTDSPVESCAVGKSWPGEAAVDRRQLTVMFYDLVGSTSLAAQLDPEDMGDLIRAFQRATATAVTRFEGHVAKLMGDGALVYFGYPRAHEDDAERAARAGLAVLEAVRTLGRERGLALEARGGIATGLVVVGELMGEGEARERGVVGETPNLAARLQALAVPGTVVVSETTRRLLGETFELQALGPQSLKGIAAPVPAWSILCEAENVSRFEALHATGMTPLVGRKQEVALLLERWQDASAGQGQAVLLSGEAGIGKSRILSALRERIGERSIVLRYQCSPHHINDAFHPIIGQISRAANLIVGEPPQIQLDKLEAMISSSGLEVSKIAPFVASLLSLPAAERYPALPMTPNELRERTIAALFALFVELTKEAPVLALLEDAHWIDPTSLDVFSRLVGRLSGLHALLVVTFRPEFAAPWLGQTHVTSLALDRIGRRHAVTMIQQITGGMTLPEEVLEQIVVRTDGVPLFVEELTKTVLESGLLREASGSYVLGATLSPLAIPSTLQDSLMARLDRLAPIKEIAQIGAAIGREFSYRLLEAVSPIKGAELGNALSQLVASELVHQRGAPPDATYIFKHALVQDTAHASLLRSRRQRIHADIAKALAERFAHHAESVPAIMAHHYTEAGLSEAATQYWVKAAEQALSRSACSEANRYVEAGLALISRLADGSRRQSLELALQLARANALSSLKGYAASEMVAALDAAKKILDLGIGSDLQRFSVLNGLCSAYYIAAKLEPALSIALEIVEVADRRDETTYKLVGHRLLGTMQFLKGQNREALKSLQTAECHRDPARERQLSFRFAYDPGLAVPCWKIAACCLFGSLDQASQLIWQVQVELPHHTHAPTVAACIWFTSVFPNLILGDFAACERHSDELVRFCIEKKLDHWKQFGTVFLACARARREPNNENITALRAAIEVKHRSGASIGDSLYMSQLAEALLTARKVNDAEATLKEAFTFVEQSGERFWLPELHRLNGRLELARAQPNRMRAQTHFLQSLELARRQESRLLELRSAIDLAQLRGKNSGRNPGTLLEAILREIRGGETASDVCKARALLAALDAHDATPDVDLSGSSPEITDSRADRQVQLHIENEPSPGRGSLEYGPPVALPEKGRQAGFHAGKPTHWLQ